MPWRAENGGGGRRQWHDSAPPTFLLDSRRRADVVLPPGAFDHRSVSLPTDSPSANFLLAQRIVLVLDASEPVQPDLAHTLRQWQDAGLVVLKLVIGVDAHPEPMVVPRPTYFRHPWYGLLATLGLRRNMLGGLGGYLPLPSAG